MAYEFVKYTSGGSGGGGIIDVTELPTENIAENAVYRVNGYANANVFFTGSFFGSEPMPFTDFIKGFVAGATIKYFVADTTPENPQESDLATFAAFYVYIVNDIALVYGDTGSGNMWMPLSTLMSAVLAEYLVAPLEDKGYVERKSLIPLNDTGDYDTGVYVTYKENTDGIALNTELVYFRGEWVDVKGFILSAPFFVKEVTADDLANTTFIHTGMFSRPIRKSLSTTMTLSAQFEKITIPSHIWSIGDEAFSWNKRLTVVEIEKGLTCIGERVFDGCLNLAEIRFDGTKAEWNAIQKSSTWDLNTGNYTIVCTDGTIAKDGTET